MPSPQKRGPTRLPPEQGRRSHRSASAVRSNHQRKSKTVKPIYPAIARTAGVTGSVTIEATIGEDGKVSEAKVVRSVPLLDQAALDAMRQWEYMPTLLNGVPVPVLTTITVNFTR